MTSKKKSAKTVDKQLVNKIVDSIMASVGIVTMTDLHGRKWKDGKRIAVLPNYVDYKHCKE